MLPELNIVTKMVASSVILQALMTLWGFTVNQWQNCVPLLKKPLMIISILAKN